MKKLILTAAGACAAAAAYRLLTPVRAHAWFSEAHKELTESALELLTKENKLKQAAFYKPYTKQLLKGCVDPDHDGDPDRGLGTHYYSCALPKGKPLPQKGGYYPNRLGDYARSARTSMEENYAAAVMLYKNDKPEQAMYALGRAAHFVEDIACPVHTASMQYKAKPNNPHYAFEKLANNVIGKHRPDRFDKRLLKSWSGVSFENPLNKLAAASNKHAGVIARLDPKAFENAVKEMAPVAAQNVMALLMRFYDDCRSDTGYMLTDGKRYLLKNEETGLVITVTAKGLTLVPADREKEQRLTFEQSELGSFALKTAGGGYVKGDLKGYEYPKNGTEASQFRFAPLGSGRWRVTTKTSGYSKVLACGRSGALAVSDFVPGSKSMVWVIV
ncbi:MAG: zinc dependent phospholipase C family protein [Ruminococcus sp.]|nr:zinc dependent phospholipase C family protein [Ruminococcus sp.]